MVRASLVVAAIAALAAATHEQATQRGVTVSIPATSLAANSAPSARPHFPAVPCRPGRLPDNGVCIPAPTDTPAPPQVATPASRLPLVAGRPQALSGYEHGLSLVVDGLTPIPQDPPRPLRSAQGWQLEVVPDSPVFALELDGQEGATRAMLVEPSQELVVTTHRVVSAAAREYAVFYLGLRKPLVSPGASLGRTQRLAQTAEASPLGSATLLLEVRRARQGNDPKAWGVSDWLDESKTIGVDPRNVLRQRDRAGSTHGTSL